MLKMHIDRGSEGSTLRLFSANVQNKNKQSKDFQSTVTHLDQDIKIHVVITSVCLCLKQTVLRASNVGFIVHVVFKWFARSSDSWRDGYTRILVKLCVLWVPVNMAQNRQVGVTDFVLLDNVNIDNFMKNLQTRYVFKFSNVYLHPIF